MSVRRIFSSASDRVRCAHELMVFGPAAQAASKPNWKSEMCPFYRRIWVRQSRND